MQLCIIINILPLAGCGLADSALEDPAFGFSSSLEASQSLFRSSLTSSSPELASQSFSACAVGASGAGAGADFGVGFGAGSDSGSGANSIGAEVRGVLGVDEAAAEADEAGTAGPF